MSLKRLESCKSIVTFSNFYFWKDFMIRTVQSGVVVKTRMPTAVSGLEIQEESLVTSVIEEVDQGEGKLFSACECVYSSN